MTNAMNSQNINFDLPQGQRAISDQDVGALLQSLQANDYMFPYPISAAQNPSQAHENANERQPYEIC